MSATTDTPGRLGTGPGAQDSDTQGHATGDPRKQAKTTLAADTVRSLHVGDIRRALEEKYVGLALLGRPVPRPPGLEIGSADLTSLAILSRTHPGPPEVWVELPEPWGSKCDALMLDHFNSQWGEDEISLWEHLQAIDRLVHRAWKGGRVA